MKLLIVHLSDLHIEIGDDCIYKMGKVGEALTEHLVDAEMCLVVLSGDIAYSGKNEEYTCALEALAKLDEQLKAKGCAKIDFIVAPGNHDCDFTTASSLRQFTIDSLKNASAAKLIDKKCIDECTITQQNFFSFAACLSQSAPKFEYLNRIYYWQDIDVSHYLVRFNCYNTAWISQIQENPNDLMFPVDFVQTSSQNHDAVFSVLHHPYAWLRVDNGKEFRKLLEKTSDIIITGHEHDPNFSSVKRISGEITDYVEGGLFQDKRTTESSFNVLIIDLDARAKKIIQYTWKTDFYSVGSFLDWSPFLRSRTLSFRWEMNEPYLKYLDDMEVTLTDPRGGLLRLSDIYIPPALKEQKIGGKGNSIKYSIVESHRTLEYIKDNHELVIMGSERSGKTALAKVLFKVYYESGEIPLLLNGNDLKGLKEEKWNQLIEREFINQYSNDLLERYGQLEKQKKCILVDDFDKSQFNIDGKIKVLTYLRKRYGRIVILTDALFRFEEITYKKRDENPLAEFRHCDILEFGYLLKATMIERWVVLGREHTMNAEQIAGQVRSIEHLVNTILGKNLLPSFPFFVLTILQSIEAQTPHTTVSGTYGYFYEHFILEALALTSREHELDTKYTFLSEIAFYAFVNGRVDLTEDDISRITKHYFTEYKMHINIRSLMADFSRVLILKQSNGSWSFKYKYEYYYFVARYMANKLRDKKKGEEIQNYVAEMSKAVYKEDYYNIIIFLSYLSHDPIIMDHVLNNAARVYENYEAHDFDRHASYLNDLVPDTPKIVYEPMS